MNALSVIPYSFCIVLSKNLSKFNRKIPNFIAFVTLGVTPMWTRSPPLRIKHHNRRSTLSEAPNLVLVEYGNLWY